LPVVVVSLSKLLYMKNTLFITLAFLLFQASYAQTATNFTCNDCSGVSHDLFTELDAGKVIVICWVMPCGSCVGPSLTTSNVVKSFNETHPGKVFMYLVDDFANTNCTSLNSWANGNNINNATLFSNSAIDMMDYGSTGMPKVVVVGDVNHQVFYNANNSVNATALQSAINTAINATTTGMFEDKSEFSSVSFFPNPSNTSSSVTFALKETSNIQVEIHNQTGQLVSAQSFTNLQAGENKIELNTAVLSNGLYFLKLSDGARSKTIKVAVIH
jgi:hypothetical protein